MTRTSFCRRPATTLLTLRSRSWCLSSRSRRNPSMKTALALRHRPPPPRSIPGHVCCPAAIRDTFLPRQHKTFSLPGFLSCSGYPLTMEFPASLHSLWPSGSKPGFPLRLRLWLLPLFAGVLFRLLVPAPGPSSCGTFQERPCLTAQPRGPVPAESAHASTSPFSPSPSNLFPARTI